MTQIHRHSTSADEPGFRELLTIMFKYKGRFLAVVLIALVFGLLYIRLNYPQYKAETKILIRLGHEKLQSLADVNPALVSGLQFQERVQNVNNEIEILKDPSLIRAAFPSLKAALNKGASDTAAGEMGKPASSGGFLSMLTSPLALLGSGAKPSDDDVLRERFAKALDASYIKESDVIGVSFSWGEAVFAADALNIIISYYRSQHNKVHQAGNSQAFFEKQLKDARAQLTKLDADLADFMKTHDKASIPLEQALDLTALTDQQRLRGQLQQDRDDTIARMRQLDASVAAKQWPLTPPELAQVAAYPSLDARYVDLQSKRSELALRFKPRAIEMQTVDNDLTQLMRQKVGLLRSYYEARLIELKDRLATVDGAEKQRHESAVGDNSEQLTYQRMAEDRQVLQGRVADLTKQLGAVRQGQDLADSNMVSFSVMAPAIPPTRESGAPKSVVLVIAGVVGAIFAIIYITILELMRQSFRGPADVRRTLNLPVLGSVPRYDKSQR